MNDPIQNIIAELEKDPQELFGRQNPFIELASLVLEAKKSGLAWDRIEHQYHQLKNRRMTEKGLYRRTPKGMWSHEMALSHDEIMGLVILSYLFDGGQTACEMWLARNWLGLYVSGVNEKYDPKLHRFWKKWDFEWLTPWRPEYRAIWKLAMGQKLSWLEDAALRANIIFSKSWNMKRVRLLFLESIGYDLEFTTRHLKLLGDKYRGRYLADGPNPLYEDLWRLQ